MGILGSIKKALRPKPIAPATLKDAVNEAYSKAAASPDDKHPFPVGRWFALSVGYPEDVLDSLPQECSDSFAGVSNVAVQAGLKAGQKVLDVGCGAGLDALIAARRVGSMGSVAGIDFSREMVARAEAAARRASIGNATFHLCDAERIPFVDAEFDYVLLNGIFNLNPNRETLFGEIFRVLKPGGQVFCSELILKDASASTDTVCSLKDWFS